MTTFRAIHKWYGLLNGMPEGQPEMDEGLRTPGRISLVPCKGLPAAVPIAVHRDVAKER